MKTFEAILEEYGFKEQNIRKPLKKLISAGLVDADSTCAWLTTKGIRQMNAAKSYDTVPENREEKASVRIEIRFLKNLEKAIGKSELTVPEREMWLNGIQQMSQNPVLVKAVEAALNATLK
ncbi:MAG: hypothetical protein MRK02_13080 [Candidatus Scalindua sp.]|nr:hypothetical protein [Candidatus Scalindua sp.]